MMRVAKWLLAVVVAGGIVDYAKGAEAPTPAATTTMAASLAANEFDIAKGSIVSLHLKRAPAYEAYEALYRQAGGTLTPDRNDNLWERVAKKPVTIDLANATFWEAIDQLEEQTDLTVDDFPTQSGLTEVHGGPRGTIWRYGAFKVVADDNAGPGRYSSLKVFAEPRLRLLSHGREATITEAQDVLGEAVALQPMMPARAGRGFDMEDHMAGGASFDVRVPMDPESRRIAYLKGKVRVVLLTGTDRAEIAGIGKKNNIEHKAFGRRFVVSTLQPTPNEYTISVAAFNSDPPAPGFTKLEAKLLDAKGNAYDGGGTTSGGDVTRRMDFNFQFRNPGGAGPAEKLVLEFPGTTRDIDVPFEFGKPRKQP
jgi:hypothetical protein